MIWLQIYVAGMFLFAFLTMASIHSQHGDKSDDLLSAACVAIWWPIAVPFLAACSLGETAGKWVHRKVSDR